MSERDEYRDSADERDVLNEDREGAARDTRSGASGDARENVGKTARGRASDPSGPDGTDRTRQRPGPDEFGEDLQRHTQ